MAETPKYECNAQELVTAMIKHKGIHEGIWALELRFNFGAMNFQGPDGKIRPASVSAVDTYILAQVDQASPLAVDAAIVNPPRLVIAPFEKFN